MGSAPSSKAPTKKAPTKDNIGTTTGGRTRAKLRAVIPSQPPSISSASFEIFLSTLKLLPFTLSEEQFETLIYHLSEKKIQPKETILKSGEPAVGVFVIISGSCNVMASQERTVLRQLGKGDFFGEISSVYEKDCTCTVVCGDESQCELALLSADKVLEFIQGASGSTLPLNQLFVQQKYIDTNMLLPNIDIQETVIKRSMVQTPIFHNWSEAAISLAYNSLLPTPVQLYEPSHVMFFPEDQSPNGYLLLSGCVEIRSGTKSFVLEAKDEGIWFGDEQLFNDGPRNLFAVAKTSCEVVVFSSICLNFVCSKFYEEKQKLTLIYDFWKRHLSMRDPQLYSKHRDNVNLLWLCNVLKGTKYFNHCIFSFLYYVALTIVIGLVDDHSTILSYDPDNENENIIVIILSGGGVLHGSVYDPADINIYPGDAFYFRKTFTSSACDLVAVDDTLVGFINKIDIDSVRNIYPVTLVDIDWYENIEIV